MEWRRAIIWSVQVNSRVCQYLAFGLARSNTCMMFVTWTGTDEVWIGFQDLKDSGQGFIMMSGLSIFKIAIKAPGHKVIFNQKNSFKLADSKLTLGNNKNPIWILKLHVNYCTDKGSHWRW